MPEVPLVIEFLGGPEDGNTFAYTSAQSCPPATLDRVEGEYRLKAHAGKFFYLWSKLSPVWVKVYG